MGMKRAIIVLFVMLGFQSIQCQRDFSIELPDEPLRELTPFEKQLAESGNDFGLTLFQEIVQAEPDTNIFISPLSVAMALGMTYNGSAGTTEEAMRNTLGFGNLTDQEINESYSSLIALLTELDPEVIFEIANSIWYRDTFPVEESFIDINKAYFDAEVSDLDFSSPSAPDVINNWVGQKTHGKIEEIINQIDPLVVMYLINAIYFNGTWQFEFDEEETQDDVFNRPDHSQVACRMMEQENDFDYFENADFQAVDLPYGNGQFSMTIFLPKSGQSVDDLIAELSWAKWITWMNQFRRTRGSLYLPKFTIEYKALLNDCLSDMGMGVAFDPEHADFTKINRNGDLYISKVLHKTYVEVDEEGTEASAVTAVEISLTSIGGSEGFVMRVDRPFFFVIREDHSQTLLFMGKVTDPSVQ
ncbi:serpin family protein [bacterium]|nr:serpin family protein [bacterium]RQV94726.1 MAG: serpin family protein [bacterium]